LEDQHGADAAEGSRDRHCREKTLGKEQNKCSIEDEESKFPFILFFIFFFL
jgi:hypothetical protein